MSDQRQSDTTEKTQQRPGVGDPAPDFALPNANGEVIRLSEFRGKKEVVLYFYPKDNTPGCTAEACAFRDNYDVISDMDAEVIGVSADSQASHQGFAAQYGLQFLLLSDVDGVARKAFDVPMSFGVMPGRVTYVIDKQGVIRNVFTSQININKHIAEALATLRQLSGQQA